MYLTLALVVFFGAIAAFFAQEFVQIGKKIFAYRLALLFIPIALASWAVLTYDAWFFWLLSYYREVLVSMLIDLQKIIPFSTGARFIAMVVLLSLVSIVPVIVIDQWIKRKDPVGFPHCYVTSAVIFLISAAVLLTSLSSVPS